MHSRNSKKCRVLSLSSSKLASLWRRRRRMQTTEIIVLPMTSLYVACAEFVQVVVGERGKIVLWCNNNANFLGLLPLPPAAPTYYHRGNCVLEILWASSSGWIAAVTYLTAARLPTRELFRILLIIHSYCTFL